MVARPSPDGGIDVSQSGLNADHYKNPQPVDEDHPERSLSQPHRERRKSKDLRLCPLYE
jgi:hypothetical protein